MGSGLGERVLVRDGCPRWGLSATAAAEARAAALAASRPLPLRRGCAATSLRPSRMGVRLRPGPCRPLLLEAGCGRDPPLRQARLRESSWVVFLQRLGHAAALPFARPLLHQVAEDSPSGTLVALACIRFTFRGFSLSCCGCVLACWKGARAFVSLPFWRLHNQHSCIA